MPVSDAGMRKGIKTMTMELKGEPKFGAERVAVWIEAFKDLDDAEFQALCVKAAVELTFFPTVGELRKFGGLIGRSVDEKATVAWENCRAAIRRHGQHASLQASDVGGDPVALWALARLTTERMGNMTQDEVTFVFSEYRRLYAAGAAEGMETYYLGGTYEALNGTLGLDVERNPALKGRTEGPMKLMPLPSPRDILREEDRGKGIQILDSHFADVEAEEDE